MGDPGNHPSRPQLCFEALKEHCSAKVTSTEITVTELLRAIHSDKHVTCVTSPNCDLHGFARAGHAESHLVTAADNYVGTRAYTAPADRLQQHEGQLSDKIIFGYYHYKWQGTEFPFYVVSGSILARGSSKLFFVLSDKSSTASVDDLIKAVGQWTAQLHEEIYVFDNGCWAKNHRLWASVQDASWDDVILDEAMKETLIADVSSFFDSQQVYEAYGVPWKRGIILHGTPGCGKTISIKALMNGMQSRDVASMYVKSLDNCGGNKQNNIHAIFSHARSMAPCLLIFEDLDSLVADDVRSYFLNEVDGLSPNNGICMIGSTNHLERLDPGISKRPSRFDRKYHYALPGERERLMYAQYWQSKLAKNSKIDFHDDICEVVAKLTPGFSFAYMKELFVQALLAIVGGRADVQDDELTIPEATLEKVAEETQVIADSTRLATRGESTSTVSPSAPDAVKTDSSTTDEERPTHAIRDVAIPAHLQSSPLLRILRKQIIALVQDMDNTKDAKSQPHARPKVPPSGGKPVGGSARVRML